MRTTLAIIAVIIIALIAAWAIDIDFAGETEMPTADVEVEGGSLPEADVDAADVEVGTEETTITTPDVQVTEPEADATAPAGDQPQ